MMVALLFFCAELLAGLVTTIPLSNKDNRRHFDEFTDPSREDGRVPVWSWPLLWFASSVLVGMSARVVWRFVRSGGVRTWPPRALPVLWVCALGLATQPLNIGVTVLSTPQLSATSFRALAWVNVAFGAIVVAYALAATTAWLLRPRERAA
jgi:hypothetical protein